MKAINYSDPQSQCSGKQGFSSHAMAVKVARKGSRAKDVPVAAYSCGHCGMYHVGQSIRHTRTGIKYLEKHA